MLSSRRGNLNDSVMTPACHSQEWSAARAQQAFTRARSWLMMCPPTIQCPQTMLRSGPLIRLTRPEAARLHRMTAIEPRGIRTLADLQAYGSRCKAHYCGRSAETRFLHWLIDRELAQLTVPG